MLVYSLTLVPPSSATQILSYITPGRAGALSAQCTGLITWGDADAEYTIYKNGVQLTGGRTSGAEPTLQLDLKGAPIGLIGGDIILVYAYQLETTAQLLNCSLAIELL
jgi:hypothetical protein